MLSLLLAVTVVGPQLEPAKHWYDSRDAHRDSWKVCSVIAGDLGLTEAILTRGGREYTPFMSNRGVRIGVGALGCIGLHSLAGKDPEKARKWAKIGLVIRGLAFAWNIKELSH